MGADGGGDGPRVTQLRPGIEAHPAGPACLEQLSDPVMQTILAGKSLQFPADHLEILYDIDVGASSS